MKRFILLCFVLTAFISSELSAQAFSQKPLATGEWITEWLLCGPFDLVKNDDVFAHCTGFETDYLIKSGGEQALKVKAGDIVRFKGGSNTWKFYTSPENIVNLDNAISTREPVFGYAYTEVYSEEAAFRRISFGSNDGGRLWVNGLRVWDYAPNRGIYPDQDVFPVLLQKGKNTILFKIEEKGGMWRLALRFLPLEGPELTGKESPLVVNYLHDGTIGLTSVTPEEQLTTVVSRIHLKISDQGTVILDETRNGDFLKRIKLTSSNYRQLSTVTDITLNWR